MRALLVAVLGLGVGCGTGSVPALGETSGPCGALPPPSAQARLEAAPVPFDLQPQTSFGSFTARRTLFGAEATTVPLRVESGRFTASATADGRLSVTEFRAALADFTFSRQLLPPSGLGVTNAWFTLQAPTTLPVRWLGSGTVGLAAGTVPIELHTALRTPTGGVYPLDVAVLPAVPLEVVVQRVQGGVLLLSARARLDGTLWSWARLFELGNLQFTAEAAEEGALIELPDVATVIDPQLR